MDWNAIIHDFFYFSVLYHEFISFFATLHKLVTCFKNIHEFIFQKKNEKYKQKTNDNQFKIMILSCVKSISRESIDSNNAMSV